jgi:hypothetical protein
MRSFERGRGSYRGEEKVCYYIVAISYYENIKIVRPDITESKQKLLCIFTKIQYNPGIFSQS